MRHLLKIFLVLELIGALTNASAFIAKTPLHLTCGFVNGKKHIKAEKEPLEDMDELTPPEINLTVFQGSSSTLFDENPVTKANNGPLTLWKETKSLLPPIITGAWGDTRLADNNPVGALYNMMFVRLPTFGMFGVYAKNLFSGHPLIMDFGYGPFQVSPIIVLCTMFLILGPGPQILSNKDPDE